MARWISAATSILPAAALVLMPKCPLCLVAWLALATGVTLAPAAGMWLRFGLVLLAVAGLGLGCWARFRGHLARSR